MSVFFILVYNIDMSMGIIIKSNIQEERLLLGMTQEALAQKVGVTRQTIISIEKGNYTPSLSLALLLAEAFNKPVEQLFWHEE